VVTTVTSESPVRGDPLLWAGRSRRGENKGPGGVVKAAGEVAVQPTGRGELGIEPGKAGEAPADAEGGWDALPEEEFGSGVGLGCETLGDGFEAIDGIHRDRGSQLIGPRSEPLVHRSPPEAERTTTNTQKRLEPPSLLALEFRFSMGNLYRF
jgi:hypothetical protein